MNHKCMARQPQVIRPGVQSVLQSVDQRHEKRTEYCCCSLLPNFDLNLFNQPVADLCRSLDLALIYRASSIHLTSKQVVVQLYMTSLTYPIPNLASRLLWCNELIFTCYRNAANSLAERLSIYSLLLLGIDKQDKQVNFFMAKYIQ